MQQWWFVENGKQVGPVSEEEFQAKVAAGMITGATYVWHKGLAEWQTYGAVNAAPLAAADGSVSGSLLAEVVNPAAAEPVADVHQPRLAIRKDPEPAAAVAGAVPEAVCRQCGQSFPTADMIQHQGAYVCAGCKATFFQRVQESGAGSGSGNTPNADIIAQARASLSGFWGLAIGVTLMQQVINLAIQMVPFVGNFGPLLVGGPLAVGLSTVFLGITRGEAVTFGQMFVGFRSFGRAIGAHLLMTVFIILWSLLLLIPGIIAQYAYAMTFFIIADDPDVGPMEAIQRSKDMMQGYKWKYFCLGVRVMWWWGVGFGLIMAGFIPFLVQTQGGDPPGVIVFGLVAAIGVWLIPLVWLVPYLQAAMARFYEDIRP